MAIKIINPDPDPDVVKRIVCSNCGVTLEYVPADTREFTRKDYTGSSDTYRAIDCPKCKKVITVGFC